MIDQGSLQNMPAGTTLDITKGYAPGGMVMVKPGTWVKINSTRIDLLHMWCHTTSGDMVHFSWLEKALEQT